MKLTHLSLFTGIGGLDLAAEHAGFITVGQCEWADYPTKILERHWPDVPRWRDIMTLTGEDFYERTGFRTVDIISGGFPCQPFSTAGNRRGKDDSRYLWPEMLRVIEELRPTWIIGENAAGIATMALDDILFELEEKNYKARAFLFPACSVGALHKRNRFAIVANTNGDGRTDESKFKPRTNASRRREAIYKREWSKIIHTWPEQLLRSEGIQEMWDSELWSREPDNCRVADGVPEELDRLKCLGNAVVPQQFYPIFQVIANIEMKCKEMHHKSSIY